MTIESSLYARLSHYLPDTLLDKLPESRAMMTAIRRLNSLHQAVSSFLPAYIAENIRLLTEDHGDLRPGTFMFADVTGFTPLSACLEASSGQEGVEVLTAVINDYFATMLEILAKSNGQLLKFAGDALLAFFPATGIEDEAPLAIRAGLRMQRAMAKFQPIRHERLAALIGEHDLELSMSIGISRGTLFEAMVGSSAQRDHIIQGSLPGMAMAAEDAGERDDVIIDAALQAAYAGLFETTPVGDGFFRVEDNFGDQLDDYEFVIPRRRRAQMSVPLDTSEQSLLEDLERQLDRLENVARFVAPQVISELAFKGGSIDPQNRPATVIFMHATGFAELLAEWGQDQLSLLTSILDRYYTIMQRAIAVNGGSLARSDPYQHGVKMLITFGAPISYPDDPERAVATALDMNRQLTMLNTRLRDDLGDKTDRWPYITQRIGITHGQVFAGEVGWQSRREYTVMGSDVNLAARLMSKAEMGQILISPYMWARVNAHFETEALAPIKLKGVTQPTRLHLVKSSTISAMDIPATSDTPFVGHDLELLTLTYALQQAKGPRRRQVFALTGDAGIGKTRMAMQVVTAAEEAGFSVAWASCQLRHSQDKSIWAAVIFQLLQLDQAKSEKAQRRLLSVRLDELGLAELEGMLAVLLFGSPTLKTVPDKPEEKTAVGAPAAKPGGAGMYDLVETRTTDGESGIFGAAKQYMDTTPPPDRPFWQSIQAQISQLESVKQFIQAFADHTPTLLVIDDVHLADPTALGVLRHVLNEVARARLMILVTCEPVEELDLNIRRKVAVSDLSEGETHELAARVLKTSKIGSRLGRLLWERTSGRPLFIESLLGLLRQDGQLEITQDSVELEGDVRLDALPDDVRELIISRVDRLPPEARNVLRVASVLGDGFTPDALGALIPDEEADHLESLLCDLSEERVIEQLPDTTYRFMHGLVQTTIYESLSRLQRQEYHRSAAEFWAEQPESDRQLLARTYHLSRGGLPLRAMELICDAANEAEQNHQLGRALDLYLHAHEIFPRDESVRAQLARLQKAQHGEA